MTYDEVRSNKIPYYQSQLSTQNNHVCPIDILFILPSKWAHPPRRLPNQQLANPAGSSRLRSHLPSGQPVAHPHNHSQPRPRLDHQDRNSMLGRLFTHRPRPVHQSQMVRSRICRIRRSPHLRWLTSLDIARDGSDPAYLSHLQSLGTVAPNPFLPLTQQSPSNMHPTKSQAATSKPAPPNSAAVMLAARRRFQQASAREEEAVGQPDFAGREFLDVMTLQKVLALHQEGVPGGEIERQLKLKKGVAGRLTNGHFAALKAGN